MMIVAKNNPVSLNKWSWVRSRTNRRKAVCFDAQMFVWRIFILQNCVEIYIGMGGMDHLFGGRGWSLLSRISSPLSLSVRLCVRSAASAQRQCGCCSLWLAVWQEVWHQNKHGCQPATHPHWDGKVCASVCLCPLFLVEMFSFYKHFMLRFCEGSCIVMIFLSRTFYCTSD